MSEEKYHWTPEYDEHDEQQDLKDESSEAEVTGTEAVGTDSDAAVSAGDDSEITAENAGETQAADAGPIILDPAEAEELAARISARRRARIRKRRRRKSLSVLAVILVFAMLFTMCGREIFRLKARNYALKKQQEELKEERNRLAKELEKVGDKEYIKDQARKQLRLLDPGEIMFVFEEDGKEAASEAEGAAETEGKSSD